MPPQYKRKKFLVDRELQFAIVFPMLWALALLTGVFVVSTLLLTAGDAGPSASGLRALSIAVTGGYFLLVLGVTLFVGVRATHRVAGPAWVIVNAVRALRGGDVGARLKLRNKDHLQGLARELELLREDLVGRAEARRRLVDTLRGAVERGERDRLPVLLAELDALDDLRPTPPRPDADQPPAARAA